MRTTDGRADDAPEGDDDGGRPGVVVFAPTPMLTVTLERGPAPGAAEVHVHAGGQGVWLARMCATLGADVCLCGAFGGELGPVVEGLVARDRIRVRRVETGGTGAIVHDRRSGERQELARTAPPAFDRHAVDDIHSTTLAEAMCCDVAVLSGPDVPGALEAATWERLAADLAAVGTPVVADLSGEALTAALRGGLTLVKASDDDLADDGLLPGDAGPAVVVAAMRELAAAGARHVLVSRSDEPALVLVGGPDGDVLQVSVPPLATVDHRGAGDSMTAGVAVGLARGDDVPAAVRLGAAAGALNITRHGLASGRRDAVERLAGRVTVETYDGPGR